MKVAFYNPPVHHYGGGHYILNPPLGLPILAAVLEAAGHEAGVYDLEALKITPQKLGERFAAQPDKWPDAVGFTATTHSARGAKECINELLNAGYHGRILVGGPHVTATWDYALEAIDWGADTIVRFECEGNIVEILEDNIDGIVEGFEMPIDDIPSPNWLHHSPLPTQYDGNLPKIGHPEGIAMWSRGCPHNCTFCGNPVFGHSKIRYRSPDNVFKDMKELALLGVRSVFVYDDELVGHGGKQNEWLPQVCERIKPLNLTWKCQGRCSARNVKQDVLQAMADAGCKAIMWGVESFSNRVLADMKKGTVEEDIWHTLMASRAAGIGNWVFLMVGNYGETVADLEHTEAQLERATKAGLVQWRQVTVCTPVPGTELYRKASEEGWLVEAPQSGPQMNQAYARTPWLSKREMRHWKVRLEGAGL